MEKITDKAGEAAARSAYATYFVSLITVGNLFIPPMRYIEQHKAEYVSKINDWLNKNREKKGEHISDDERTYQTKAMKRPRLNHYKPMHPFGGDAPQALRNFIANHFVTENRNVRFKMQPQIL